MSNPFHILILSVGSLLGQNLLDALDGRRSRVLVTGLDCSGENPRVFRCNKAYKAPLTESPEFSHFLRDVIEQEQPDLILPGRDQDVLALAELGCAVPVIRSLIPGGAVEAVKIMNDKGLSCRFAKAYGLPFADSFVLDEGTADQARAWARTRGFPLLAKPRMGFGSLGIRVICDEIQLGALLGSKPEGFLLQKMLDVSDEWRRSLARFRGELDSGIPFFFHLPDGNQFAGQTIIGPGGSVGRIFTSRSLMVLGRCERTERWDDPDFIAVTRAFAEAVSDAGWRGVFNLQCRRTSDGYVGIEMNGRMTGSTSARGWLGYDEMRQLILEFRNFDIGPDNRYRQETKGTVYRSLTDYFVAEADRRMFDTQGIWLRGDMPLGKERRYGAEAVEPTVQGPRNERRRIVVTGSTGYLGQSLVNRLSEEGLYEISVISGDKQSARKLFRDQVTRYYDQEDWFHNPPPTGREDILLHLGFARPHHGNSQIAKSLQFTSKVFLRAAKNGTRGIINVSSRSVYGLETPPPWTEETPVAPLSVYGQAKLGSELLLQSLLESHPKTVGTSIRLGTVSGGSNGLVDVFVLSKFARQALSGDPIRISGGSQEFDIIDIKDTVDAFAALLRTPPESWKPVYNLGSKSSYNIVFMAQLCVEVASRFNKGIKAPILLDEEEVHMRYGMDSSLFYRDMNWRPKRTLEDTIESLMSYYVFGAGGGGRTHMGETPEGF